MKKVKAKKATTKSITANAIKVDPMQLHNVAVIAKGFVRHWRHWQQVPKTPAHLKAVGTALHVSGSLLIRLHALLQPPADEWAPELSGMTYLRSAFRQVWDESSAVL